MRKVDKRLLKAAYLFFVVFFCFASFPQSTCAQFGGMPFFDPSFGAGFGGAPWGYPAFNQGLGFFPGSGYPSAPFTQDPMAMPMAPYDAGGFGGFPPFNAGPFMPPWSAGPTFAFPSGFQVPPIGSPVMPYGTATAESDWEGDWANTAGGVPMGPYGFGFAPAFGGMPMDPFAAGFGAPLGGGFMDPFAAGFGAPFGGGFMDPRFAAGFGAPFGGGFMDPFAAGFGAPLGGAFMNPFAAGFGAPLGGGFMDPRFAQGNFAGPYQPMSPWGQQPWGPWGQQPYWGNPGNMWPFNVDDLLPDYGGGGGSSSSSTKLPSIAGTWEGEYTVKNVEDPNSPAEDWSGTITLVLKQKEIEDTPDAMKLSGTATITGWDIYDEETKGKISGTINFENQKIEPGGIGFFITYGDGEYGWVLVSQGSTDSSGPMKCSFSINGMDNYFKTGNPVTFAKQ